MDYKNIDEIKDNIYDKEFIVAYKDLLNETNYFIYSVEFHFINNDINKELKIKIIDDYLNKFDVFELKELINNNNFIRERIYDFIQYVDYGIKSLHNYDYRKNYGNIKIDNYKIVFPSLLNYIVIRYFKFDYYLYVKCNTY